MPTLAAKIAPQRSTQYATLAVALATPELRLSPLGPAILDLRPATLAGQSYLLLDTAADLDDVQRRALSELAATTEFYWFHESVGGVEGPFLQPIAPTGAPYLPAQLVEARRYRGKTNELFGRVLINVARWALTEEPSCLLDPLMGGGTFAFIALQLGLDAIGIERQRTDFESTDAFLGDFLKDAGIRADRRPERIAGGRRTLYTIHPRGAARPLRALLAHGDTADAPQLLAQLPATLRPNLVVADLPYGVQHSGDVRTLRGAGLPAWHRVARPEAVLALAWDATRTTRDTVAGWVEEGGLWSALRGGAWEQLGHPVDRVIKRRDVLVARRVGLTVGDT